MKTIEEVKEELHKKINNLDNEYTLHILNEEVLPYVIESRTKEFDEEELTTEQEEQLNEAIREADAGDIVDYGEFKKRMARWLTK